MALFKLKEVAQIADVSYGTLRTAKQRNTDICGIKLPEFYKMGRGFVCDADDGQRFANEINTFKRDHVNIQDFAARLKLGVWTIYMANKSGYLYGVKFPDSKLLNNERWYLRVDVERYQERVINHILNRNHDNHFDNATEA